MRRIYWFYFSNLFPRWSINQFFTYFVLFWIILFFIFFLGNRRIYPVMAILNNRTVHHKILPRQRLVFPEFFFRFYGRWHSRAARQAEKISSRHSSYVLSFYVFYKLGKTVFVFYKVKCISRIQRRSRCRLLFYGAYRHGHSRRAYRYRRARSFGWMPRCR